MNNAGFISSTATALWRSSAAKVSTEAVGDRTVSLVWSGRSTSAFTVLYAPSGAKFQSRRVVAHPRVNLIGLKPGLSYQVRVTGNGFDASTSFTTVASAQSPGVISKHESAAELPLTEISRLEIRVGKILECEKHPDADSLYVEKIDVGEQAPRTIVSGLVKYVPLDEMIGRTVVVLCNLKPRAMRGVTSHGMLLCASNEDHTVVDPLSAPPEVPIGELVTFEGHKSAPIDPSNRATKAFDRIADGLRTNNDGVAMFEDVPFLTSAGACFSPEKLVGSIS